MRRAILLASAIATTMRGFLLSLSCSQLPARRLYRCMLAMTLMAPTINSRRISRCPIFDVRPSRCFPPLECWRGVRPRQAEKSRPLSNVSIAGAKVSTAIAQIGPMPGIVRRSRAVPLARLTSLIFAINCSIIAVRWAMRSRYNRPKSCARSGRSLSASSRTAARRDRLATPCGAMIPNSARCPRKALIASVRWPAGFERRCQFARLAGRAVLHLLKPRYDRTGQRLRLLDRYHVSRSFNHDKARTDNAVNQFASLIEGA